MKSVISFYWELKKPMDRFYACLGFFWMIFPLFIAPTNAFADYETGIVKYEVAQAYLDENPYIIANYSSIHGHTMESCLFKVEKTYMEEGRLMISGPVVLLWKENSYSQRTYQLPDTLQIFTDELTGNYHLGYYKPMRAAIQLGNLFLCSGNTYSGVPTISYFPNPEVFPGIKQDNNLWMDQLPGAIKDYCVWWYKKASIGPPVLHEFIDSVLSIPEGGSKTPPDIYIDYNCCPEEGCISGKWKALEEIPLYKEPNSTKISGKIANGETFTGIKENVYVTPLKIIACNSLEVYDSIETFTIEPGRTYYILSCTDQGVKIWLNGRIMLAADAAFNPWQEWWVYIQTEKGKKGWFRYSHTINIIHAYHVE